MRPSLFLAVLALALAAGGCGKDKIVAGGPAPTPTPPRTYPILLNPYSVMDALKAAYERRDSTEIKALYDNNYQGSSLDQTDISPTIFTFSRFNEVEHVAAMAHDSTLLHVSMILAPVMQRFTDPSDPPGWATIQNPIASLEVSSSTASRTVDIANDLMEFKFIPRTPDSTSVTDTTWKIVRWIEVRH